MEIAAEPMSPSGSPSAADWVAISITAVSETSITTSAVVASAAIAIALANNDDHPRNEHDIDNCLHDDGHDDVIIDNGLTSLALHRLSALLTAAINVDVCPEGQ
jgi:hypothetical protein